MEKPEKIKAGYDAGAEFTTRYSLVLDCDPSAALVNGMNTNTRLYIVAAVDGARIQRVWDFSFARWREYPAVGGLPESCYVRLGEAERVAKIIGALEAKTRVLQTFVVDKGERMF